MAVREQELLEELTWRREGGEALEHAPTVTEDDCRLCQIVMLEVAFGQQCDGFDRTELHLSPAIEGEFGPSAGVRHTRMVMEKLWRVCNTSESEA